MEINTFAELPCVIQVNKNLSAMRETWVLSLGREDPLEEGTATHSNILAWRIPMDRGAWQAAVHGVTKSLTQLKQLSMYAYVRPAGSHSGAKGIPSS